MNLGIFDLIKKEDDYFVISNHVETIKVPAASKGYFEPHYFVPRWATRFNHMQVEAYIDGHYECYYTDADHKRFTVFFESEEITI